MAALGSLPVLGEAFAIPSPQQELGQLYRAPARAGTGHNLNSMLFLGEKI